MTVQNYSSVEMAHTFQFADAFSKKDADSIEKLLHEDCALFDPALKWVRGKEKILNVLKEGFKSSQEVSYDVVEFFQDKQVTIVRFEIQMDEKKYVGVDFMRWEDDKMQELICYYNP